MSNIVKFLLMALAWAVLFLGTYYGCIKPEYCPDEPVEDNQGAVAPVPTNDYALVSSTGSNDVLTGAEWDLMLQDLLNRFSADSTKTLEVYGNYYESEPKPADYQNMGFLRAAKVKELLVKAGIPAASILELSRKLPAPAKAAGELWPAATFNLADTAAADEPDKSQVVQLDKDNIIIRFPYNKSTKTLDTASENYLQKLAERLKQTNEQVNIVGHTDERGKEPYNIGLGQRRADFVKARLVSYGAPAARISTSSKGETTPEVDKKTEAAFRLNRRAVLTLIRQQ